MYTQYFWIRDQKPSKTFSLHEKQDKKILQNILGKHHSKKHHKRVHPIYTQTEKTPRPIMIVLTKGILVGDDYNRF